MHYDLDKCTVVKMSPPQVYEECMKCSIMLCRVKQVDAFVQDTHAPARSTKF